MKSSPKALSVVICTLNRSTLLGDCLKSLENQAIPLENLDIVVVDNGSTDNTFAVVQKFRFARYFFEAKTGLSNARNRGVAESLSSLVAFVDDDVEVFEDWAQSYIRFFERAPNNILCAGGSTFPKWESDPPDWIKHGSAYHMLSLLTVLIDGPMQENDSLLGANLCFRKEAFDIFGGFNPKLGRNGRSLISGEEFDLIKRIARTKYEVWRLKNPKVYHRIERRRMTLPWFFRRTFDQGRTEAMLDSSIAKSFDYKDVMNAVSRLFSFKTELAKKAKIIFLAGYFYERL